MQTILNVEMKQLEQTESKVVRHRDDLWDDQRAGVDGRCNVSETQAQQADSFPMYVES